MKIAAVITSYFPYSHADVIVTKFMKGIPTDEGLRSPRVQLASLYIDQTRLVMLGVTERAAASPEPLHQERIPAPVEIDARLKAPALVGRHLHDLRRRGSRGKGRTNGIDDEVVERPTAGSGGRLGAPQQGIIESNGRPHTS